MNGLISFLLGAGAGLGALLIVAGISGRRILPSGRSRSTGTGERVVRRIAVASAAGLAAMAVSGWMVAAILAAAVAWAAPAWLRSHGRHRREIEMVEAIASWAEMLRDTMAGAAGLEQAIGATGPIAPRPLASAVTRLAARLDFEPLTDALRRFADDVSHPTCDFVVAALVIAADKQARDLSPLLSQLAECARDEARLRTRIWIDRAKTRTSVAVIAGCVLLFAAALLVVSRRYLAPYGTVTGQVVLVVIAVLFVGSFIAMDRMGRIANPDRFISRRPG
jgi:Flp pilus assembly protein TadB